MLETSDKELREAIKSLGDGTHSMNTIENEVIKLRGKITNEQKKKRKRRSSTSTTD